MEFRMACRYFSCSRLLEESDDEAGAANTTTVVVVVFFNTRTSGRITDPGGSYNPTYCRLFCHLYYWIIKGKSPGKEKLPIQKENTVPV